MSISEAVAELLRVPLREQPATYYRLLGITSEESSPADIERAAYRQISHLEAATSRVPDDVSRSLYALIAESRRCLIDAACRRSYDDQLVAGTTQDDQVVRHYASSSSTPENTSGAEDALDRREWTLGAARDCDIVIDDPFVSRRHCRIVYEDGKYWVEDLGSSNGTFHNSEPVVSRKEISLDDAIGLGKTLRIKWSQYIALHQDSEGVEPRPVLVHVARRTLKFGSATPVLPAYQSTAGSDAAPAET
jgi:pSer/pThr/pTyr-binding forkhead associated (FHA) protein